MGAFKEKIIIITGGASGIGKALGQRLSDKGAHVILADVNTKMLEDTVNSISKEGGLSEAVTLDVTDRIKVKQLVDDTVAKRGRLDYMFNNAGIGVAGEARDFSYEDWQKVIDTNLYGTVNGVFAAYHVMVKQGFGHIINTASLAGLIPVPGEISYTASKYGIVGLSNALRIEGTKLGVRVSVVCPGLIDTPIYHTVKAANVDREKFLSELPKKMTSADSCARIVLKGVERNKAIIIVTPLARIMWITQRVSPGLIRIIWALFLKILRKARISD
ncbi:MAG: SDR family oxidoreductase [Deltaproteobacteria bacterium]|nr:SDR family oxidoreductase [Deltaproteobacteria bacterium]